MCWKWASPHLWPVSFRSCCSKHIMGLFVIPRCVACGGSVVLRSASRSWCSCCFGCWKPVSALLSIGWVESWTVRWRSWCWSRCVSSWSMSITASFCNSARNASGYWSLARRRRAWWSPHRRTVRYSCRIIASWASFPLAIPRKASGSRSYRSTRSRTWRICIAWSLATAWMAFSSRI